MVFALGVLLFALGIALSIALHEAGHMWVAQATGMKVRRYFIGFGPKIFSFRRGETEYGLKALPLGGFCDIAGMTAIDELAPDEEDRAMYKKATWRRLVVMSGGIAMNFLLGLVLIYGLAVGWGLPNLDRPETAVVGSLACVSPTQGPGPDFALSECSGTGPAEQAGIRAGDTIVAVDGAEADTFAEVAEKTRNSSGPHDFTVDRDGERLTLTVPVEQAERWVQDTPDSEPRMDTVGAIGIVAPPNVVEHSALSAVPASFGFAGDMFTMTVERLIQMPEKAVDLWQAVTGGERDPETPVSVYGASVLGGEIAEQGIWEAFVLLLASLNFFLAIFNLLPLLPLDGGHMAVTVYEHIRNWFRKLKGLPRGAPVDYMKLLPVTYVFIVIGGAYMLLTLTADIVNPIKLFP
ncbi:M50 family metallopeptidase [Rhodococcus sp. NPDC058521]|uniref:M50 family metallopeptidase n=1 Tax=Rhodococcus sp. NPDC058521 TaxID=3346536 RepID=UPI00365A16D8